MPDWSKLRESILSEQSDSVLPPTIELPTLPQALTKFQERAKDPNAEAEELSQIIATDAGMSTELLRIVNGSTNGLQEKVTSVKQALLAIGIRRTLLHLTTSGMREMMKSSSSKLINFKVFWATNLERSLFAREIASHLDTDADLAFTAGMLQDFLLPLITNQLLDEYLEFLENRGEYQNLPKFEYERLGFDHAEAAAHVMYNWNFPDELICCVHMHHRGLDILDDAELRNSPAAAVAIASLLPDALRQETMGMERLTKLEEEWRGFHLRSIAEKVDEALQEMTDTKTTGLSFLRNYENFIAQQNMPDPQPLNSDSNKVDVAPEEDEENNAIIAEYLSKLENVNVKDNP